MNFHCSNPPTSLLLQFPNSADGQSGIDTSRGTLRAWIVRTPALVFESDPNGAPGVVDENELLKVANGEESDASIVVPLEGKAVVAVESTTVTAISFILHSKSPATMDQAYLSYAIKAGIRTRDNWAGADAAGGYMPPGVREEMTRLKEMEDCISKKLVGTVRIEGSFQRIRLAEWTPPI